MSVLVGLLVAACANPGESAAPSAASTPEDHGGAQPEPFAVGETVRLDLPRGVANVSDDDVAAVVAGDWSLGLDLFRVVAADENTMVSPYSVATALSMLYAGARGRTAVEIAEIMNLGVEDGALHEVRNYIDSTLRSAQRPEDKDDEAAAFTIRPANSVWGQGGYAFLDDYLRVLAIQYGAGLRLLDFSDPAGASRVINDWTEKATEGRIEDFVSPDVLNELTRLVLVNAIWFEGNWAEPFTPETTSEGPFTLADGSQATTSMMQGRISAAYAENAVFRAIRLPYRGDAAMVIALPDTRTPAELASQLDLDDLDIEWIRFDVELTLPRFEFRSEIPLTEALKTLGMRAAFAPPATGADDEADFTAITETRQLFVSETLHETFLAVDEYGTEASAATAVIMSTFSTQPDVMEFTVDRPFLFWIEHTPTGEPLFLGQVTNPTSS